MKNHSIDLELLRVYRRTGKAKQIGRSFITREISVMNAVVNCTVYYGEGGFVAHALKIWFILPRKYIETSL
jgi:hypothetical protein